MKGNRHTRRAGLSHDAQGNLIDEQGYLTLAQAAKRFLISESYLYMHIRTLPHYRLGPEIRFKESELAAHFKAVPEEL